MATNELFTCKHCGSEFRISDITIVNGAHCTVKFCPICGLGLPKKNSSSTNLTFGTSCNDCPVRTKNHTCHGECLKAV